MASRRTFTYPSVTESESRMLDDLVAFLRQCPIMPELAHGFTLGVSEAFTNALVHANKLDPRKTIIVNLEVNDDEVRADITDQGQGGLAAIAKRPRPELLAESGRGVDLMYRYCETVEFVEVDGGGLCVTMKVPKRKSVSVS